jgi:hypothetical protein
MPTMPDLVCFVHTWLCGREGLDVAQTPLRQSRLVRSGAPCGLFFQVEGPRLLRGYAIWSADENRVLFYDSAGERTGEVLLSESPMPSALAA